MICKENQLADGSWRTPRPRGRVLVADGTQDIRLLFAAFLRTIPVETSLAETGQIACEMVVAADRSGRPFDLILMEVEMPVLDGLAATRKMRQAGYGGTIIAHSVEADGAEKCRRAGCDGFLAKPFRREELLALLEDCLQGGRQNIAARLPAGDGPSDQPEPAKHAARR